MKKNINSLVDLERMHVDHVQFQFLGNVEADLANRAGVLVRDDVGIVRTSVHFLVHPQMDVEGRLLVEDVLAQRAFVLSCNCVLRMLVVHVHVQVAGAAEILLAILARHSGSLLDGPLVLHLVQLVLALERETDVTYLASEYPPLDRHRSLPVAFEDVQL